MERETHPGHPSDAAPGASSRSLLAALTADLERTAPDLPAELAAEIRGRVPGYRSRSAIGDDALLDACIAHLSFVASDRRTAAAVDKAEAIGAARAEADVSLADVLDAVRVGAEFIWSGIVQLARAGSTTDAELVTVAGEVWSISDVFAQLISTGYRRYEKGRIIDGQRERYALIETVLSGHDQPNATLWQAVDRIGLPRDRHFVVVAVAIEGSPRVPTPEIDRKLRRAGMESAWLLRADVELGIVCCRAEQLAGIRDALVGYHVRAGISPMQSDYSHLPQTVRLARTALAAAGPAQVSFFADSAIGTMAAGAPDVAGELTSIVLDPVLELPERERDLLLETVNRWYDSGGSVSLTASGLYVHPNTVRNRIRRLEVLTARSLGDPRHSAEIYLALVALAMRSA